MRDAPKLISGRFSPRRPCGVSPLAVAGPEPPQGPGQTLPVPQPLRHLAVPSLRHSCHAVDALHQAARPPHPPAHAHQGGGPGVERERPPVEPAGAAAELRVGFEQRDAQAPRPGQARRRQPPQPPPITIRSSIRPSTIPGREGPGTRPGGRRTPSNTFSVGNRRIHGAGGRLGRREIDRIGPLAVYSKESAASEAAKPGQSRSGRAVRERRGRRDADGRVREGCPAR